MMLYRISIIHGPNLNLLGNREKSIYGTESFESFLNKIKSKYGAQLQIDFYQSNHEGDLIDYIQSIQHTMDGIIINPAAYTHTSIALRDVLLAVKLPCIEVHISDISSRENFRQNSFIKDCCISTISGLGLEGYDHAIQRILEIIPHWTKD